MVTAIYYEIARIIMILAIDYTAHHHRLGVYFAGSNLDIEFFTLSERNGLSLAVRIIK
jgi:hypothetical protein